MVWCTQKGRKGLRRRAPAKITDHAEAGRRGQSYLACEEVCWVLQIYMISFTFLNNHSAAVKIGIREINLESPVEIQTKQTEPAGAPVRKGGDKKQLGPRHILEIKSAGCAGEQQSGNCGTHSARERC